MRSNKSIRRLLAALLSIVMALSLAIPAFALEIPDDRPDLAVIAGLYADWDGSYELPDLGQFPETDQEIIKAMVDEILISREAEAQAAAQAEIQDEIPLTISFSDVSSSHTFYRGIIYCAGKGIVNGYPDNTFRPGNTVTKNHFCAMLARGFYSDQIEKFNTDYYKKAGGTFGPTNFTLANNGTLKNTSFQWNYSNASAMNTGIDRYDMARLMTNIMQAKGFAASTSQKNAVQSKIADYKNIPSQYQDAVKNVYALGIIGGYTDGSFKGTNIMNRGQAAIVIQRMAQYAPVKGDDDNTQYDDGKEIPGTGTGNTGNTGSGSTGSSGSGSTGNSSSGSTGTTTPAPDPKPETPAVRTLANGKPITESNVTAILEQLKAKYPTPTSFKNGYAGMGSGRSATNNCIKQIVNTYKDDNGQRCSTTIGCGGWAAFIADEIFGQASVTWKKTTMANIRPGDLIIDLDTNGCLSHVNICAGPAAGYPSTKKVMVASASPGTNGYMASWVGRWASDGTDPTYHHEDVYTAYPD